MSHHHLRANPRVHITEPPLNSNQPEPRSCFLAVPIVVLFTYKQQTSFIVHTIAIARSESQEEIEERGKKRDKGEEKEEKEYLPW